MIKTPPFQTKVANLPMHCLLVALSLVFPFVVAGVSHAETDLPADISKIQLERVPSPSGNGYGYSLVYYVPAPIDVFWDFKTDFDSDILLTSNELVGHRLVKVDGNDVYTENKYASAPGLKFLWKTTVINDKYRLDFELMNADECRHKFHHGYIQLTSVGRFTRVSQNAFFDFTGASFWVSYPWYGGMKYTLTQVAKWEQRVAYQYRQMPLAASVDRYAEDIHR